MTGIYGALQAIGYGLLVLFFAAGVVKTCGSFAEVRRPEQALKLFVRFALAKAAVDYGLDLMLALFDIVQGMIDEYNRLAAIPGDNPRRKEEMEHLYLRILYNIPCGFELTAGMTTNYQQLKTIYRQRRHHRLPDWQVFCDWCETLPRFMELTQKEENNV